MITAVIAVVVAVAFTVVWFRIRRGSWFGTAAERREGWRASRLPARKWATRASAYTAVALLALVVASLQPERLGGFWFVATVFASIAGVCWRKFAERRRLDRTR